MDQTAVQEKDGPVKADKKAAQAQTNNFNPFMKTCVAPIHEIMRKTS